MTKKIIPFAIIAVILVLVTLSIVSKKKKSYPEIETVSVTLGDFSREVSANGEINSSSDSVEVAKVSGNIQKVFVIEGNRVKIGDVLVTLEKKDLDSQVRNAAANLESTRMNVRRELLSLRTAYTQAVSGYEKAARDFERSTELQKIGSASDEELRQKQDALSVSKQNLAAAKEQLNFREGRPLNDPRTEPAPDDITIVEGSAEVNQAKSQLKSLNDTIENYEIKALSNGIVTQINVKEGGVVGIGTIVATIHDDKNLEIVTNIDEVDLSYLRIGQTAKIESDSFIGESIEGIIKTIAPIIRKVGDTRVCEISISITKDEKKLARIGASCSVFIEVEKKMQVSSIPVESYFFKDGKSWVALLDNETTEGVYTINLKEITTGILGIDTVEITSGLSEGEKIVSKKPSVLKNGQLVMIKKVSKDSAKETK